MENPVIDELTLQLSSNWEITESVKVEIFSTLGLKLMSPAGGSVSSADGGGRLKIDVSSLPSGVYFVRIGDRVEKFVKL
jgi:hypothetical protein